MAVTAHVELFRGEAALLTDTITGVNITGWTLRFQLKRKHGATETALVTKTTGSGITITAPTTGVLTVALTAANLTQEPGLYVYEIARTDAGSETMLTRGHLTLLTR